ncbi:MAG: Bro-N domain-containing protein [Clostridia bacterium]|nr:Bro-N domain-containing protein [Clostridia bacterium]
MKTTCICHHHNIHGDLRMIRENGELLFCAKDIGRMLGWRDITKSLHRHCGNVRKYPCQTASGTQMMNFIDTTDLVHLFAHSKHPAAEEISDWLTETVLPRTRQTDVHHNALETFIAGGVPDVHLVIGAPDYFDLLHDLFRMCSALDCLSAAVLHLPCVPDPCGKTVSLAEKAAVLCAGFYEKTGLRAQDVRCPTNEVLNLVADNQVCLPEDAGYLTAEKITYQTAEAVADCIMSLYHG